jgi:hypothetical protein
MAAFYWIKVWHELIGDKRVCRLSDHLWRRMIEVFVLAGEEHDGGWLPDVEDMAYELRCSEESLTADLVALEAATRDRRRPERPPVVQLVDGRWFVSNWKKRQEKASDAERQAQCRKRARRADERDAAVTPPGHDGVTNRDTAGHDPVTNAVTDEDAEADTEVQRTEADEEADGDPAPQLAGQVGAAAPPRSPTGAWGNDEVVSLDADTPGADWLMRRLQANASARGRDGPRTFATVEQKAKFLESEEYLGYNDLSDAIAVALGNGIDSLDRLVNWLAKYEPRNGSAPPLAPADGRSYLVSQYGDAVRH